MLAQLSNRILKARFGQITRYTIPCITDDTSEDDVNDGERPESSISIGYIKLTSDLAASLVMSVLGVSE